MEQYSIGDSVVNTENLKMANVIQINESENKIQVSYSTGGSEWIPAGNVKKLLLETDPPSGETLLG
jgi:hypothetical protein|tara:strand:+ start:805 stop:1002 length:198 start_codon:yes stop_codon:yes gene_type:complete